MTNDDILGDAELFLAQASRHLIGPLSGECLLCYIARMISQWGCQGTRFMEHYRDSVAPRATALRDRMSRMGACCCDCEVFLNAYELRPALILAVGVERSLVELDEFDESDDSYDDDFDEECDADLFVGELPSCRGVRRGSTQPCANWQRQFRPRW